MIAFVTGLALGAVGSLHCVGMCGPLAMALPYQSTEPALRAGKAAVYSLGRTVTYLLVGLLMATLGEVASMAGFQRGLSVSLGLVLIVLILSPRYYRRLTDRLERTPFYSRVKSGIRIQFQQRSILAFFTTGLLNGLLPCTMVYLAAFAAINTGSWQSGALLMVGFGIGTSPMLLITAAAPSVSLFKRINWHKVVPFVALLAGTLMIVRGVATELPDIPELGLFNPNDLTLCR